MATFMKVSAQDYNQTSTGRKRGRPVGSKNKTSAATKSDTPTYTWKCNCGNKQIMHIRCYSVRCGCGKFMNCDYDKGVLS